jgi:hypothetical protein
MGFDDAKEKNNVCKKWHQVGHGVYLPDVQDNPTAQGGEEIVNYPVFKEKEMPTKNDFGMKNDFAHPSMEYLLLHLFVFFKIHFLFQAEGEFTELLRDFLIDFIDEFSDVVKEFYNTQVYFYIYTVLLLNLKTNLAI